MNKGIFAVLAILALRSPSIGQPLADQGDRSRFVSVFASVGYLEFMTLGLSAQISDRFSLGLVSSAFVLSERRGFLVPDNATGFGLRATYYLTRDGENFLLWANAIVVDVQYLTDRRTGLQVDVKNPRGIGIETVFGRDGIVGPGIGILWGVGIAGSFYTGTPPLIMPAVRFGVHVDI